MGQNHARWVTWLSITISILSPSLLLLPITHTHTHTHTHPPTHTHTHTHARMHTHTHIQKVVMQWKTADLSKYTHDDTTFSMTYRSEDITMVTNNGHMISSYLGEMIANGASHPLENCAGESQQSPTHEKSSFVKSMGEKIEEIEAQRRQARPTPSPRPTSARVPPQRPSRPPLPRRHAALRSTKSVPLYRSGCGQIEAPSTTKEEGGVYEVPVQHKQTSNDGKGWRKKNSTPLAPCNEIPEKGSPQLHVKFCPVLPPYPHQKSAVKHLSPVKKRRSSKPPDVAEMYLVPSPPVRAKIPQKWTHRSESDIISIECPTESSNDEAVETDVPTSPSSVIYKALISITEYAKPVFTFGHSPERSGRSTAAKHKLCYLSTSAVPSSPLNLVADPPFSLPSSAPPLASPTVSIPQSLPPSIPAPPPPSSPTPSPTTSSSLAAPSFPTPPLPPPHVVEEDMKEVDNVFEAEDLVMQVKFSRDSNPIYDNLEALKINSSLKSSDVTFHSFSTTLERRKSKRMSQIVVKTSSDRSISLSPSSSPSTSPTYSAVLDSSLQNESSELLSILSRDLPRRVPLAPPGGRTGEVNGRPGDKKKVSPNTSPPPPRILPRAPKMAITKNRAAENEVSSSALDEVSPKFPKIPIRSRKTPSASPPPVGAPQASNCPPNLGNYSTFALMQAPRTHPHPPQAPSTQRDQQSSRENLNHEYAEIGNLSLVGGKAGRKKSTDYPWVVVEGSVEGENETIAMATQDSNNRRRPLPITLLVPMEVPGGDVGVGGASGEGEGREVPPPKPPRLRHRREKMLEKGDSVSSVHKAVSSSDILRVSYCDCQTTHTCFSAYTLPIVPSVCASITRACAHIYMHTHTHTHTHHTHHIPHSHTHTHTHLQIFLCLP